MTIIGGIPCSYVRSDQEMGRCVVLAADSEETGYVSKSSVSKIAEIGGTGWKCLVGGSGNNGDFIDLAVQDIEWVLLTEPQPLTLARIRKVMEEIVTRIHEEKIDRHPAIARGENLDFELLAAAWAAHDNNAQLIKVSRSQCVVQKHPRTIGAGGHLADYLLGTFFDSGMTLGQALRIAVYLLQQVKQYAAYCGGASQVLWLADDGRSDLLLPQTISEEELSANAVMTIGAKWLLYWTDPWLFQWDRARVVSEGLPKAIGVIENALKEAYKLPSAPTTHSEPEAAVVTPTSSTSLEPPSEPTPGAEQK